MPPTSDTKPSKSPPLLSQTASKTSLRRAAPKSALPPNEPAWKLRACTGFLASPDGLYITHPDPAIYRRTRAYFKELVQFCGDLGGQVMIIGSPMQRNLQEGWDYQDCWNRMRGAFEGSWSWPSSTASISA